MSIVAATALSAVLISIKRYCVSSKLTSSVMHDKPQLFHNQPLPFQSSCQYQITLPGDRGTECT